MTDEPDASAATICPRCSVGCRLRRRDTGSRASGVGGPANPNGRLCRNGVEAFDVVADRDRLTSPMVRRGDDLAPTDWGTAYDRVVDSFQGVLDEVGPDALAFLGAPHCTNEENYLLQKLARTLGTNNVDNRARLCHVHTTTTLSERLGWPATTNGLDDLGEADVILVAGANPAERQPVAFDAFVRPAVNDGTTLVHVEPVGNRTTRLADVHVAPRPGCDALLFDLVSARLLDRDGVDRDFVDRRTRGFDEFAEGLAAFDLGAGAAIAGVEGEEIEDLANRLAAADRVAALAGTGIEGAEGAPNASEALLDLLLSTGNVGRRGTGLFVLRGLVNEQGATDAGCVPDRLPGHRPVTDEEARDRVATEWGTAPPTEPGRTATELVEAFGGDVRAALVVGENPAVSKRDPEWLRRQFESLEALVVADVAPSDTTAHADVVLPAAAGVEKAGTVTNLERRVQRLRPTTPPPGEARSDFQILADLGERLVGRRHFDYSTVGEVFEELARIAPPYVGLSYDDLGEGCRWPVEDDGVLYRDAFATPSGRATFGPPRSPPGFEDEAGLHLVTGGRASDTSARDDLVDRSLRIHPDDASDRAIDDDDRVVVVRGAATVETTASVDGDVRPGTVYLHAAVADPLLRREESAVAVWSVGRTVDATE